MWKINKKCDKTWMLSVYVRGTRCAARRDSSDSESDPEPRSSFIIPRVRVCETPHDLAAPQTAALTS